MIATDLLATARRLAKASPHKPRQADLRRAVSTAYYALFHAFAEECANLLVGVGGNAPAGAWAQTYRALEHGHAKTACREARNLDFPAELRSVAQAFATLQDQRHDADYNPMATLARGEAFGAINLAEIAIRDLRAATRRDRVAFAVHLVMRKR